MLYAGKYGDVHGEIIYTCKGLRLPSLWKVRNIATHIVEPSLLLSTAKSRWQQATVTDLVLGGTCCWMLVDLPAMDQLKRRLHEKKSLWGCKREI